MKPQKTAITRRLRGFTFTEMMVTIAITSGLILLVNQVFNSVTGAVRQGKDVSTIIDHATTFSTQMFSDGKEMITYAANPVTHPESTDEPAAFLMIVQQTNSDVTFPEPQKQVRWANTDNWTASTDPIHSSQLLFFRYADKLDSLAPASASRYDSDATAKIAAVWYGHLAPPDRSGNATGVEIGVGPDNQAAIDLVLGRQALLIVDDNGLYPDGENPPAASNLYYANFGDANNAAAIGYQISSLAVNNISDTNYNSLWEGATDVLTIDDTADAGIFSFHEMFTDEIDGTGSPPGLYAVTTGHSNVNYQRARTGFTAMLDDSWMPNAAYHTMAENWGYPTGSRLTGADEVDYPYEPRQVGRIHPYFIPYMSDFAVDFAADITDDYDADGDYRFQLSGGDVAATPSGTLAGQYSADGLPDGTPDEYAYIDANGNFVKAIKWYNAVDPNPDVNAPFGVGDVDADKPITWPIPSNAASSPSAQQNGPYHSPFVLSATGTPYPPYISDVDTPGSTIQRRAVFVFGHTPDLDLYNAASGNAARTGAQFGDGTDTGAAATGTAKGFESGSAKWWPYLIRIRYRLHDRDGSFSTLDELSGQAIVGRWFEQIIPVPRK